MGEENPQLAMNRLFMEKLADVADKLTALEITVLCLGYSHPDPEAYRKEIKSLLGFLDDGTGSDMDKIMKQVKMLSSLDWKDEDGT